MENGILTGFDGKIMPNSSLTRAQMAAVINKAFGAKDEASLSTYSDVSQKSWYYHQLAKAVRLGIISGDDNKLNPNQYVTREEVFAALAKLLKLTATDNTVLDRYSDKTAISHWAIDGVAALVSAGYITGTNGKINPKKNISRAEFAQVMDNVIKNYIRTEGTYNKDFNGNVIINVPGVTLKNMKITGDLIIGDGVGDGEVTLDTVTVIGRTVVRGGGENSIKIIGKSNIQNIIVARIDGTVRVYAEDGISVGELIVDGSDDVIVEGTFNNLTIKSSDIVVKANNSTIHSVQANGENSNIVASGSTDITKITVDAKNVTITASEGTKIGGVVANSEGTNVNGAGKVERVAANANNIKVTTAGTSVSAALGTSGVTAGASLVAAGSTSTVTGENTGTTSGNNSQGGSSGTSSGSNSSGNSGNGGNSGNSGNGGNSGNNGNQPQTVYVKSIVVTSSAISITENKGTLQMSAIIAPSNATNKSVEWSITSGSGIAVIDSSGLLSASDNGVVTVRATATDGSGVFGELDITITGQPQQNMVQARTAINIAMNKFKPTNSTTESDILNLANSVVTKNISIKIRNFNKIDATNQSAGSITCMIEITNSIDSTTGILSVRKNIGILRSSEPIVLTVSSDLAGVTFTLQVDNKKPVTFVNSITLPTDGEQFKIYCTPPAGKVRHGCSFTGLRIITISMEEGYDIIKFDYDDIMSLTPTVELDYMNSIDINNTKISVIPGEPGTKSVKINIEARDSQNQPISKIGLEDITLNIKASNNEIIWFPLDIILYGYDYNTDGVIATDFFNDNSGMLSFKLQFTTDDLEGINKFADITDGSTIYFDVEISGVMFSGLEAQLPSAVSSNTITFESAYGDKLVANKNVLSIGVEAILTEDIDFSKIKYSTSVSAENSISLTGTYKKVAYTSASSPLPGTYFYHTYAGRTIVYIGLTAEDAASIKGLTGFGNDNNYGNANSDRLIAEDGWYPGTTGGEKLIKLNYFFTAVNNSTHEIINLYEYDNTSWIGGFGKRDPGWCNGDEIGGEIYFYTDKIVLYSGTYCEGIPTSGYMKIITITEDSVENVDIDDTGWIEINGSNFGNP